MQDSTSSPSVLSNEITSNSPSKKGPFCARCRNHQQLNRIQGHKRYCKYSTCTCTKCLYVKARQVVTANQVKEKRRSAIDEKLRSEGRILSSGEPSIPSLQEELQSLATSTVSKTESELNSAILDLFLARIHIDTEAFFEFVKPFIKQCVRQIQDTLCKRRESSPPSSSSSCAKSPGQVQSPGVYEVSVPSLMKVTTSDMSDINDTKRRETHTPSKAESALPDKLQKDHKSKTSTSSQLICSTSNSTTNQFMSVRWPTFDVNYTLAPSLVSTDAAKAHLIELMAANVFATGGSTISDEILARYRYLKAVQDFLPSTTYCPP